MSEEQTPTNENIKTFEIPSIEIYMIKLPNEEEPVRMVRLADAIKFRDIIQEIHIEDDTRWKVEIGK